MKTIAAALMNVFNNTWFARTPNPAWVLTPPIDEEIPRYPPFMKGLPAAPVQRIMTSQTELINAIEHDLSLPDELYQAIAAPVIERYAAFSHLLPASESHHHRGAGGLFRHGLEVAHLATQAAQGSLFAPHATPKARKALELRWRLAVCFAGLLHDIGKPVSDMAVVDRQGQHTWNPCDENLTDWASQHHISHYFLRWRDNRHKRHEQFAALVIERVLTREARTFLLMPGPDIMQALLETIQGLDRGSTLFELVMTADRKSVERDMKAHYHQTDSAMGMPVEKYLFDAMRRLIKSGKWLTNDKGARVWRFKEGVYIVWRTGAQDVVELLAKDKVPGIPRDEDTLADILIERGLAIPKITEQGRQYRYWRIQPEGLDVTLYMLRLASIELVFSGEPPVVVGGCEVAEVIEKGAEPALEKVKTPSQSLPDKNESASLGSTGLEMSTPAQRIDSEQTENAITSPMQTIASENLPMAELETGQQAITTKPNADTQKPKAKKASQSARNAQPVGKENDQIVHATLTETAKSWLNTRGQAGEWLTQIANTSNTDGSKLKLTDTNHNGTVLLPFPETAELLGVDPNHFIKILDEKGWLVTDVLTPMRKVQMINQVRGVLLAPEPSQYLKQLLPIAVMSEITMPKENKAATKIKAIKSGQGQGLPAKGSHETSGAQLSASPSNRKAASDKTKSVAETTIEHMNTPNSKLVQKETPVASMNHQSKSPHELSNNDSVTIFLNQLRTITPVNSIHTADNAWVNIDVTDISQFLKQNPTLKRSAFLRELTHHPECKTVEGVFRYQLKP
jgi:hypothetical protein